MRFIEEIACIFQENPLFVNCLRLFRYFVPSCDLQLLEYSSPLFTLRFVFFLLQFC